MPHEVLGQILGFCAGSMISISALPRIVSIWRDRSLAAKESVPRNALLTSGNLVWIASGLLTWHPAIAVMCGVSFVLNGIVLWLSFSAQRRP